MKSVWLMSFRKLAWPWKDRNPCPFYIMGIRLDAGYRIDLLVQNEILVKLKSATELLPVFEAQILTCMRLSGVKIGRLMNFNVSQLKKGIRRFVL